MSKIETIANSLQRRTLHPVYRLLDSPRLRFIYTTEELVAQGKEPEDDPVAPWVNHWFEHGFLMTVCFAGGIGAFVGWLPPSAGVLLGAAFGASVAACVYWWREKRNGTLGTFDGRWDAIAPTVWALALWMVRWWAV